MTAPNLSAELSAVVERNGWARRPAVHTETGSWTHGELHDLAARTATVLARAGIGPGHRVLIALPDGIGWMAAFLACARIGGTAVPVNPDLPAADHRFMLDDCAARLVITTDALLDRFTGVRRIDQSAMLDDAGQAPPAEPVVTGEPLYVHYTSGTTGTPKGVVHRQGSPAVYHRVIGKGCLELSEVDVTLSVSKLYFTYGFCNAFVFPLYSGSAVVLSTERLTPAQAAELAARHRVTRLYAVPSWYARLLTDADPAAFASVRAAVSGGERLTAELTDRVTEFLGAPLLNQLGATEIGCAATANRLGHNVAGSIGPAVPEFEVRAVDERGNVVDTGVEGDLLVRGPVLMAGYLNRPEDSAEALRHGWLRTKDRVIANPDGSYTHVRRADDMEMVGGITVSPLEVEDLLGTHRDVREVAVAAVPNAAGATVLRAFVVPAGRIDSHAELADELIALARSRLAAFKVPRSVRLVDALPRTPTGKLRRHRLRQPAT